MTITNKTSPSRTSPTRTNPAPTNPAPTNPASTGPTPTNPMQTTDAAAAAAAGTDFRADLRVGAAPARVLAALCDAEAISGWWGSTTGSPAEGHRFGVGFGSTRQIDMTVIAARPWRVEWAVDAAPHTPEWAGTTIAFDLVAAGGGTEVHFLHDGLTPALECYDMCHGGWTHYLASLVRYVETGTGDPYREH